MRILASAPAKVILFGEHYVVYGAPGLVAAIEPYNEMELDAKGSASPGLEYRSTIKENDVTVELLDSPASSALRPSAPVHPYAALYRKLADELPRLQKLSVRAEVKSAWPLKGVCETSPRVNRSNQSSSNSLSVCGTTSFTLDLFSNPTSTQS